eukprot:355369-Chlamydomonas_euryale.AAC.2
MWYYNVCRTFLLPIFLYGCETRTWTHTLSAPGLCWGLRWRTWSAPDAGRSPRGPALRGARTARLATFTHASLEGC